MKTQLLSFTAVMLSGQTAFACGNAMLTYYSPSEKLFVLVCALLPIALLVSSLAPRFDVRVIRALTVIVSFLGFGALWSVLATESQSASWDQLPAIGLCGTLVAFGLLGASELWRHRPRFKTAVFFAVLTIAWVSAIYGYNVFGSESFIEVYPYVAPDVIF